MSDLNNTITEQESADATSVGTYFCGRRKIFCPEENITEENIISVLNAVLSIHCFNVQQEEYLYWYRRGVQPIIHRTREIRSELTKHVVVNNADMVVSFKNGYFMTEAATYSPRFDDETITENVSKFNEYCYSAGKSIADNEIIDWFDTVGLGVLYVDLDRNGSERTPFRTYALDPRSAFCAYSYNPGNKPLLGVNMVVVNNGEVMFDAFTERYCYRLRGGSVATTLFNTPLFGTAYELVDVKANVIGKIPIIEYQFDINRMGAFESAMSICDEINEMQSRLAEGQEEQIQQLAIAYNCNFDEGTTANDIRKQGMLVLRSLGDNKADFKLIETKLSQAEIQINIDALYEQLLDKTGLPSIARKEGGSSDNGSAVYLKSGYSIADTHRRNTEDFWRKSDTLFKEVALAILKLRFNNFRLEPEDMDLNIEPPTMSNLLVKTQAALNMRNLGLSPQIWLERSGLSNDPLTDIELSKDYIYKFYEQMEAPKEQAVAEGEALADDRQVEELSAYELD